MKNFNIAAIKTVAEPYDERFCRDGGSYYQPTTTITTTSGDTVVIEDTSCGDFGTRIYAGIQLAAGDKFCANWGSMEPDRSFSNIPDNLAPLLDEIQAATGYHIPTTSEWAESLDE